MKLFKWLLFSLLFQLTLNASSPADISFIVIDLKYNANDGVKICEVQQGLGCVFYGVEHLERKKNAFGEIFCDLLSKLVYEK